MRENEEAVALYEDLGFVTVGVRRGYYPDTGEDALVMGRDPRCEDRAVAAWEESGCGRCSPSSPRATILPRRCSRLSGEVLATVSHSQDSIHERYGGVVPEVASRAHVERMTAVVREALRQAGCGVTELGGVAATVGPGLIGALLVGVQTAKAIAWSHGACLSSR